MAAIALRKIFCIIDPTTNDQRALARAIDIAARTQAAVHAYVCFTLPAGTPPDRRSALKDAEYARHRAWLSELLAQAGADRVTVTSDTECSEDWRGALVSAATHAGADLIVRTSTRRSALQRRLIKTADWTLLREANCPVLFVKTEQTGKLDKVLAAVNIKAKDEPHQRLTDLVIDYAKAVSRLTGAELHAVNAYQGSINFVHPPDLAKYVGIERGRAHVGDAAPDELISQVAEKLGAPMVVVGSIPRTSLAGGVVGNTAERILDNIQTDMLSIVQQP